MADADFLAENDNALQHQNIVLRDILGFLAVQILCSRNDISSMNYSDMLCELYKIIDDLHSEYHYRQGNFGT